MEQIIFELQTKINNLEQRVFQLENQSEEQLTEQLKSKLWKEIEATHDIRKTQFTQKALLKSFNTIKSLKCLLQEGKTCKSYINNLNDKQYMKGSPEDTQDEQQPIKTSSKRISPTELVKQIVEKHNLPKEELINFSKPNLEDILEHGKEANCYQKMLSKKKLLTEAQLIQEINKLDIPTPPMPLLTLKKSVLEEIYTTKSLTQPLFQNALLKWKSKRNKQEKNKAKTVEDITFELHQMEKKLKQSTTVKQVRQIEFDLKHMYFHNYENVITVDEYKDKLEELIEDKLEELNNNSKPIVGFLPDGWNPVQSTQEPSKPKLKRPIKSQQKNL